VLRGVLVQTQVLDAMTFATVVVLLASVSVIACLAPTWRASALDPAVALRHH
jgi:ABC-type lipoprotein release transport system permease subunit